MATSASKPLKGCVIVVDRDAFEKDPKDVKKLEGAGAIVVKIKPGARVAFTWPPGTMWLPPVK